MIVNPHNIDINQGTISNPSITLLESKTVRNNYSYPDPNSYFILSEAGKDYSIIGNSTILLNFSKGYYEQFFSINDFNSIVLNFSKNLFKNSKPIDGKAKLALEHTILKIGKKQSSFKNRF